MNLLGVDSESTGWIASRQGTEKSGSSVLRAFTLSHVYTTTWRWSSVFVKRVDHATEWITQNTIVPRL